MASEDSFWGNIFKNQSKSSTISLLKNIPIFSQFKYLDLSKFSKILHERIYAKGEVIFNEGEMGESLFIVKSGKVKIVSSVDRGKQRSVTVLEDGSFFGEVSLVDNAPRSAAAIAEEETEALVLFRADLLSLMDRNPRLAAFFLLHLSMIIGQRLRANNDELNKIKFQHVAT